MPAATEMQFEDADHAALVQAFIERWSLQEDAQQLIARLDQVTAQKVMDQFNPRDVSRDVNPIFHKFTRSLLQGVPQKQGFGGHAQVPSASVAGSDGPGPEPEKVIAFIEQWSLETEAQSVLYSLDGPTQVRVIQEFSPRDTSRDANIIFIKFAQGLATGSPRGGKGKGFEKGGIVLASQWQQPHLRPGGWKGQQQVHNAYASVDDAQLTEFIQKWSLHAEAQTLLIGLDPAQQMRVIQEFNPRDASRDCNPVFCKFVQQVSSGGGKKGMGKAGGAFGAPAYKGPPSGGKGKGGGSWHGGGGTTDLATFIAQWSLGPDAQNLLYGMDLEAQQKVMTQFSPRDTSSDVNNIFMRFAQGIAGGTGKGANRFAPY